MTRTYSKTLAHNSDSSTAPSKAHAMAENQQTDANGSKVMHLPCSKFQQTMKSLTSLTCHLANVKAWCRKSQVVALQMAIDGLMEASGNKTDGAISKWRGKRSFWIYRQFAVRLDWR